MIQKLILAATLVASGLAHAEFAKQIFDFAPEPNSSHITITPTTAYDAEKGYGYLLAPSADDATKPSVFATDVPEGNYRVTVRLGNAKRATNTTIKAESRRLMLHNVSTKPGEFVTRQFTVNVRKPEISEGKSTRLNGRELGPPIVPDWDEHLSLEINGTAPGLDSLAIQTAPADTTTIFIAGDSTVTDQAREPYAGWGQMLPRFFDSSVAVSNHAESGLALFSFAGQRRLEKVLSMMQKGDYLFIQFGHNDQKDRREGAGAFTTYKKDLEDFIDAARKKGGIPVVISPMERLRIDKSGKQTPTLADYSKAAHDVATTKHAPFIDLSAMSTTLYGALGYEHATSAFVFYPANTFPGQTQKLKDQTHHNNFGAYELARCVVEGIRKNVPDLAAKLDSNDRFDPAKPDSPDELAIPLSPVEGPTEKPAGN